MVCDGGDGSTNGAGKVLAVHVNSTHWFVFRHGSGVVFNGAGSAS
jgi:hypothetical protein